jgi:low affinity Fe/Cu permease
MRIILVVILILILLGALPVTPWASGWGLGYYPSGTALVLIILILFLL